MPEPKKRPPGAYALFLRKEFKSRQSNVPFSQHAKNVAKKWREMDPGQKQVWTERAAQVRINFKKQAPKPSGRRTKKPRSAFIFFCSERRQQVRRENPTKRITVISKILGRMWKQLSAEEKSKYTKMAESDKKRYYGGRGPKSAKAGQRTRARSRVQTVPQTQAAQRTQARNLGRARGSASRNAFFSRTFTSSSESSSSSSDSD